MYSDFKTYLILFGGVSALSTSAIFVKIADAPSSVTAFYRLFMAGAVLLPFFLFLPVLFAWVVFVGLVEPQGSPFHIDVRSFTLAEALKVLLTCGSGKIPFYQYTWFISCYFVLMCLFPLQARLSRRVGRGA